MTKVKKMVLFFVHPSVNQCQTRCERNSHQQKNNALSGARDCHSSPFVLWKQFIIIVALFYITTLAIKYKQITLTLTNTLLLIISSKCLDLTL